MNIAMKDTELPAGEFASFVSPSSHLSNKLIPAELTRHLQAREAKIA